MHYDPPLTEAVFLRRYKRFLVDVELPGGEVITAHIANTGSMRACTAPRAPVRLSWSTSPTRKLPASVEQIRVDGRWILVNTARPNAVIAQAIAAEQVAGLGGLRTVRREVTVEPGARLDLHAAGEAGKAWIEIKNVTLRDGDRLRFPDSITARGLRHAQVLARLAQRGQRSVLLYCVGTEGGAAVHLADDIDPAYALAVRSAASVGVEVMAVRCAMSPQRLWISGRVPVIL